MLKKTYLSLLPTEQVVDLLAMGLWMDMDTEKKLWPSDLKQTVVSASVTVIVGEGAKYKRVEARASTHG